MQPLQIISKLDDAIYSIKNKSCTIVTLMRDNEKFFPRFKAYSELLGSYFNEYKIVVYENDSIDQTKTLLSRWAVENLDVILLPSVDTGDETKNQCSHKERIEKMAFFRNQYMDYFDKQPTDYLIVIDSDMIHYALEHVLMAFADEDQWDACLANGCTKSGYLCDWSYYDTCATILESNEWMHLSDYPHVFNNYINYIPVISGFGGIGIYKGKNVQGLRYDVPILNINNQKYIAVEHVVFHKHILDNGGKVVINSNMITHVENQIEELKLAINK